MLAESTEDNLADPGSDPRARALFEIGAGGRPRSGPKSLKGQEDCPSLD